MERLDGYADSRKRDCVWCLKKGLVWAGRTRNEHLGSHIESEGSTAVLNGPAIYIMSSWNRENFAFGGFCWDRFWEGIRHAFERYQHKAWYHWSKHCVLVPQRTYPRHNARVERPEQKIDSTHTSRATLEAEGYFSAFSTPGHPSGRKTLWQFALYRQGPRKSNVPTTFFQCHVSRRSSIHFSRPSDPIHRSPKL